MLLDRLLAATRLATTNIGHAASNASAAAASPWHAVAATHGRACGAAASPLSPLAAAAVRAAGGGAAPHPHGASGGNRAAITTASEELAPLLAFAAMVLQNTAAAPRARWQQAPGGPCQEEAPAAAVEAMRALVLLDDGPARRLRGAAGGGRLGDLPDGGRAAPAGDEALSLLEAVVALEGGGRPSGSSSSSSSSSKQQQQQRSQTGGRPLGLGAPRPLRRVESVGQAEAILLWAQLGQA